MRRYAQGTTVSVDRSRAEIERALVRYGASGFGYGWERRPSGEFAAISFGFQERRIRLDIPMPEDPREQRQRWRAVLLVIKAKLEAVESGIGTLDGEFLANVVTDDGMTIGDKLLPRLSEATRSGRLLGDGR